MQVKGDVGRQHAILVIVIYMQNIILEVYTQSRLRNVQASIEAGG